MNCIYGLAVVVNYHSRNPVPSPGIVFWVIVIGLVSLALAGCSWLATEFAQSSEAPGASHASSGYGVTLVLLYLGATSSGLFPNDNHFLA
ncbi:hypothetical protein HAX54_013025 [Datura stramonium]|uniref:Uncharacterized protein n=1 Tax=Datura stramonium TaxID=4076 RepID=A0ABS8TMK6_DATST|nr:hypothetical protein [Datura stramonium]